MDDDEAKLKRLQDVAEKADIAYGEWLIYGYNAESTGIALNALWESLKGLRDEDYGDGD